LAPAAYLKGRKERSDREGSVPMLRRWRKRKRLQELAKLWATLDAACR
jgi:hypothetical protein